MNSISLTAQFSHSVVSDSLWPCRLHHARLPCPSPTLGACSNSCPLSRWCRLTISSSVIPFSSCFQSFSASGSFPWSQFFASGSRRIAGSASASGPPVNIQGWFPLELTDLFLLAVQGTLNSIFQHHSLKASVLWLSVFLMFQLSYLYMIQTWAT